MLSALHRHEQYKFLPVLMEVIVWGATDEDVDDLVDKIVRSNKNQD